VSVLSLRFRGALNALSEADRRDLLDRATEDDDLVRDTAAAIIDLVRHEGDSALKSLAREYDKVKLASLEIPMTVCAEALEQLDPPTRRALQRAAKNIEATHRAHVPVATQVEPEPGITVSRRPEPLGRVGVYVPGGRGSHPSSVLMAAIPARVAGVAEVIVCTPPGPSGRPGSAVLAACALTGVTRLFLVGGAGAVAAMAYGTESIPRVDRIVGSGNAWVSAAKVMVSGTVSIDAPCGPPELLIVCDDSADPAAIAREMVAQAESDEQACVVAVALGAELADGIITSLVAQAAATKRATVVKRALERNGGVLVAATREQAAALATLYAPQHVLLALREAEQLASTIRHAGTVVLGTSTAVAFGAYMTGANDVLPPQGLSRSYSGLSTQDFVRWTSWQRVTPEAAVKLAEDVAVLADAEGLDGRARSARALRSA
jgi:histidinol dehydrogenase